MSGDGSKFKVQKSGSCKYQFRDASGGFQSVGLWTKSTLNIEH
jgi:hypothetical protein